METIDLAALGFNSPPISRSAAKGEVRVLGLGDSFAFGPVRYPHTYYAIAGDLLSSRTATEAVVRFVNLGEPGTSFPHYVDRYRYWREIVAHDAVVFTVYLGNDLLDLTLGHAPHALGLNEKIRASGLVVRPSSRVGGVPRKYPLRILDLLRFRYLLWSGAARAPTLPPESPYHDFALQLDEELFFDLAYGQLSTFDPQLLPAMKPAYREMIDFVRFVSETRRTAKAVAIVLAPHQLQVESSLREALAERYGVDPRDYDLGLPSFLIAQTVARVDPEVPLLDLTGPLATRADAGAPLYFGTNTHWSAEGNRLVGELLARFLARHWRRNLELQRTDRFSDNELGPVDGSERWQSLRKRAFDRHIQPLLAGKGEAAPTVRPSEIAALEPLASPARYGIQSINGVSLAAASAVDSPLSVPKRDGGFHVTGWAVDPIAEDLAAAVWIEIGGSVYRASYGLPREDVARSLGNARYRHGGFSLWLPPDTIRPGTATLSVRVISRDGMGSFAGVPLVVRIDSGPGD